VLAQQLQQQMQQHRDKGQESGRGKGMDAPLQSPHLLLQPTPHGFQKLQQQRHQMQLLHQLQQQQVQQVQQLQRQQSQQRPRQLQQGGLSSNDQVSNEPMKSVANAVIFRLNGTVFQIPGVQDNDPLDTKIAALRSFLAHELGLANFHQAYESLMAQGTLGETREMVVEQVKDGLGPKNRFLVPLIEQLLLAENIKGAHTGS
jgi:hypothetical protein